MLFRNLIIITIQLVLLSVGVCLAQTNTKVEPTPPTYHTMYEGDDEVPNFFRVSVGFGMTSRSINTKSSNVDNSWSGASIDLQTTLTGENGFGGGLFFNYSTGETKSDQGRTTQKDNMVFVGPGLCYRIGTRKFIALPHAEVGYYYLSSKTTSSSYYLNQTLKGETFGYGLGVGFDYRVSGNVGFGAGIQYISGAISKVTIDNRDVELSDDNVMKISQIAGNFGIKFWL